jgi:NADPH:quinone reductase-like Zn-dependent oxidoreductase
MGSTVRSRSAPQKARLVADFNAHALARFDTGDLKPVLHRTFPLAQAQAAHDDLQNNQAIGKIVLIP